MSLAIRTRIAPACLALIAITALGGCTKKITITQYPVFWERAPKSIAVTPFRNNTNLRHIAMGITSDLATKLSSNGSYKVYDRTLLKAYLNEHDMQMAFSSDEQAAASAMAKIGKVKAILTGAVTVCNWPPTRSKVKVISQRFFNPNGTSYTRPVRHYTYTNEAEIKVNASMLRITPNGPQVIHSTPVRGYMKSTGPKPKYSREGCLAIARALAVRELVEQFAVVRKIIKIKPSESFFTATGQQYAGEWPKSKNFSIASGQKIILVMRLPERCRRNKFTITVNKKDDRNELARFDIMWTREMTATPGGKQFVFDPSDLASRGGGPGNFVIRLYSGQAKPSIEHKIKIKP